MKTVQTWLNDIQYGWEESNHTLPYPQLIKLAKRLELASQFVIRTKTSSTEFQASSYQLNLRNDDCTNFFIFFEILGHPLWAWRTL